MKRLAKIVAVISVLALLTVVSSAAPAASGDALSGTLEYFVWMPDNPEIPEAWARQFMDIHPNVTVNIRLMSGDGIIQNLQPRIATDSLPDVFSMNGDMVGVMLADNGLIADIGDTKTWDNIYDSLKNGWTSVNGVRFGISGGVATTVIFYNMEIFEQAGITELPTDFDEFLETCETLKNAGFVPIVWYGGFPNMLHNGPFSYGIANNIANKFPNYVSEIADGTFDLTIPEVVDIFGKIKLLPDRGYVQPGYMSEDYMSGVQYFTDGRAAMLFQGNWMVSQIMNNDRFETGIFLPPWNEKGANPVPVLGSETGWSIANNDNQELSKAFLDFMCGDGFAIYQNARQCTPPFKEAPGEMILNEKMSEFMDYIGQFPIAGPLAFEIFPAPAVEETMKLMQQVLNGDITPEAAAQTLDRVNKEAAASN